MTERTTENENSGHPRPTEPLISSEVLAAETPNKAMELAGSHEGGIDLLMTDVVMPEMNGRDFADQLKRLYPEVRTLFTSCYKANVIAQHNVLEEGRHFLQKPFTINEIPGKVAEVLSVG